MGWNTSAVFVAGLGPDDAADLLDRASLAATGETATADVATSGSAGDVVFQRSDNGWTEIWDPAMRFMPTFRPTGAGLSVIFSSVTSTYGFTLFDGGAPVRDWLIAEGEVLVDEGPPLPVEADADIPVWGPDEDFIWTVIEAMTGRAFDPDSRYQTWSTRG